MDNLAKLQKEALRQAKRFADLAEKNTDDNVRFAFALAASAFVTMVEDIEEMMKEERKR